MRDHIFMQWMLISVCVTVAESRNAADLMTFCKEDGTHSDSECKKWLKQVIQWRLTWSELLCFHS